MARFVVKNEAEMIELGEKIAGVLGAPRTIELIGDVGAGKTTFVKGLAKGLGVVEDVTSPSFVVSKRYVGETGVVLVHYDFYRLEDAGVMVDELMEAASDERAVVVVEWAEAVAGVLSEERVRIVIRYGSEEMRVVEVEGVEL